MLVVDVSGFKPLLSADFLAFMNLLPAKMSATTVFDSVLFGGTFGTQEPRGLFSERAYVSHMIDDEEAESIIPASAADAIRQHNDVFRVDWRRLTARTTVVGYPVLPLIEQMAEWCRPDHEESPGASQVAETL